VNSTLRFRFWLPRMDELIQVAIKKNQNKLWSAVFTGIVREWNKNSQLPASFGYFDYRQPLFFYWFSGRGNCILIRVTSDPKSVLGDISFLTIRISWCAFLRQSGRNVGELLWWMVNLAGKSSVAISHANFVIRCKEVWRGLRNMSTKVPVIRRRLSSFLCVSWGGKTVWPIWVLQRKKKKKKKLLF
jgi:hypothetical protein